MTKDKTKAIERIRARTKPENIRFIQKNLSISHQIAMLLKEKGWSQKKLAKEMGKQESEVSKILSGRHNITLSSITKIEAVLNKDIIITPLVACSLPQKTEYITFYIHKHSDNEAESRAKYFKNNVKYEESHGQNSQVA